MSLCTIMFEIIKNRKKTIKGSVTVEAGRLACAAHVTFSTPPPPRLIHIRPQMYSPVGNI